MLKFAGFAVTCFLAACSLHAEILLWMLDSDRNEYQFDYARIRVEDTESYLDIVNPADPSMRMSVAAADDSGFGVGQIGADLGGFGAGSSFILELYQFDEMDDVLRVATSQAVGYSKLADHILGEKTGSTPYSDWQMAVPEPTSGLLVLVGAALLALRRRRNEQA